MRINAPMLTWGLVRSKTAYDRAKLRMGVRVWRWSWTRGVADCLRVAALRKGAMVLRRAGMVTIWESLTKTEGCRKSGEVGSTGC